MLVNVVEHDFVLTVAPVAGLMYDSYMKEFPVSEARENLADVIEEANRTGDPIAVTRRGKRVAVLVDPAEYERLTSSLEDVLDRAMLQLVREEDDFIPWEQAKQDLGLA